MKMEEINLSQLVVYQKEEELRKTKSKKKVSLRPVTFDISFSLESTHNLWAYHQDRISNSYTW